MRWMLKGSVVSLQICWATSLLVVLVLHFSRHVYFLFVVVVAVGVTE